ncbi:hypothetical protein HRH25_23560 [Flavisolibacter sp. BT320]|nr:hypothetical protein [Flavisolibacter longurius]
MEQKNITLSLNALAFGDAVTGALPGCTTIDADNNDNGFLPCARAQNPGAGTHGSTAQAIANLITCMGGGTGRPNIIGHGNEGLIVTGTGDETTDPDKYIYIANQSYWEPYVRQLRGRVSGLSLWACHPGTGATGADFLYNLARVINAPVAGPTGFVYCGGGPSDLYLEPGSVWQVATPTQRPNPINAPTPFFRDLVMNLNLNFDQQYESIPVEKILNIEYIRGKTRDVAPLFSLAGNSAKDLVNLIQFDTPFNPGGIPAAVITGKLVVTFEHNNKQEQREFNVYNNRLIQDTTHTNTFYSCLEGFKDAVQMLF